MNPSYHDGRRTRTRLPIPLSLSIDSQRRTPLPLSPSTIISDHKVFLIPPFPPLVFSSSGAPPLTVTLNRSEVGEPDECPRRNPTTPVPVFPTTDVPVPSSLKRPWGWRTRYERGPHRMNSEQDRVFVASYRRRLSHRVGLRMSCPRFTPTRCRDFRVPCGFSRQSTTRGTSLLQGRVSRKFFSTFMKKFTLELTLKITTNN